MSPMDIFSIVSGAWGMAGVTVGGLATTGVTRHKVRKAKQRYKDALQAATGEGELALCISIGGRNAPDKDLAAYLAAEQPGLNR